MSLSEDQSQDSKVVEVVRKRTQFYQVCSKTKICIQVSSSLNAPQSQAETSDINAFGGYTEQVKRLRDMLDVAFEQQKTSDVIKSSIEFPKGVLVYGPSGCGELVLLTPKDRYIPNLAEENINYIIVIMIK